MARVAHRHHRAGAEPASDLAGPRRPAVLGCRAICRRLPGRTCDPLEQTLPICAGQQGKVEVYAVLRHVLRNHGAADDLDVPIRQDETELDPGAVRQIHVGSQRHPAGTQSLDDHHHRIVEIGRTRPGDGPYLDREPATGRRARSGSQRRGSSRHAGERSKTETSDSPGAACHTSAYDVTLSRPPESPDGLTVWGPVMQKLPSVRLRHAPSRLVLTVP